MDVFALKVKVTVYDHNEYLVNKWSLNQKWFDILLLIYTIQELYIK